MVYFVHYTGVCTFQSLLNYAFELNLSSGVNLQLALKPSAKPYQSQSYLGSRPIQM